MAAARDLRFVAVGEGEDAEVRAVDVVLEGGTSFILMTVLTLVAGTSFIMWLGEQITERGIGNGRWITRTRECEIGNATSGTYTN